MKKEVDMILDMLRRGRRLSENLYLQHRTTNVPVSSVARTGKGCQCLPLEWALESGWGAVVMAGCKHCMPRQ